MGRPERLAAGLLLALAFAVIGWAGHRLNSPLAARHPERIAPILAAADLDGDGEVDAAEYARIGDVALPLAVIDVDGDGVLAPGELEAALLEVDPAWMIETPR